MSKARAKEHHDPTEAMNAEGLQQQLPEGSTRPLGTKRAPGPTRTMPAAVHEVAVESALKLTALLRTRRQR